LSCISAPFDWFYPILFGTAVADFLGGMKWFAQAAHAERGAFVVRTFSFESGVAIEECAA
jgi:hypothetical protein